MKDDKEQEQDTKLTRKEWLILIYFYLFAIAILVVVILKIYYFIVSK